MVDCGKMAARHTTDRRHRGAIISIADGCVGCGFLSDDVFGGGRDVFVVMTGGVVEGFCVVNIVDAPAFVGASSALASVSELSGVALVGVIESLGVKGGVGQAVLDALMVSVLARFSYLSVATVAMMDRCRGRTTYHRGLLIRHGLTRRIRVDDYFDDGAGVLYLRG